MKIPAVWWFLFWAVISITFLLLGFATLDETELSNLVSPVVMFLFKCFMLTFSLFSISYGMYIRPKQRTYGVHRSYFWMVLGVILSLNQCTNVRINKSVWGFWSFILIKNTWLFHFLPNMNIFSRRYKLIMIFCILSSITWLPRCIPIFPLINFILIGGEYYINPPQDSRIAIQMALETSLFLVTSLENTGLPHIIHLTPIWAYIVLLFWSELVSRNQLSGDESFKELLPVAVKATETFSTLKEKTIGKLIKFAVGMTVPLSSFFNSQFVVALWRGGLSAGDASHLNISFYLCISVLLLASVVTGCTVCELEFQLLSTIAAKVKRMEMEKLIEFAAGTIGTILFQYFYKLTSFNVVLAFLYLAVTWVASLVLLGVSHDFGVLAFTLGNVMASTVSLSGLGMKTWLMFGASLLLFGLRLKLEPATLVPDHNQIQVHLNLGMWGRQTNAS